MQELVLATRNAHKVSEVGRMLAPFHITVAPLPPEVVLPPEDGDTYSANALIKARAAAEQLSRAVIADDSGIEADALGGRPGVRSARYSGAHATDEENLRKLLSEVPPGSRLRYVCAVAFVDDGFERVFLGECEGRMAPEPRGEGGFGYDPVFVPDEPPDLTVPGDRPDLTMAELSDAQKDLISHRGNALRDFARWFLDEGPRLRR